MTEQASERIMFSGKVEIPYKFQAGRTGTRFLRELRDNERIMGLKCPACNRVYVPPRSTCKECFAKLDQWVEVSGEGTLLTYTVLRTPRQAQLKELHRLPSPLLHAEVDLPIAYGIIQLDGADTGFVHLLGEVDFEQLRIGMRVQAVFKEEREGNILDIKYFKPLS